MPDAESDNSAEQVPPRKGRSAWRCHIADPVDRPPIVGVRRASEMNAKAELTVAATVDDIQADA
jgi:hypothetical protein